MSSKVTTPSSETIALRQFKNLPGPRPWPLVGNALQVKLSRLHQDIESWARQYGPVFKMHLGPTKVLVIADNKIENLLLKNSQDG